MFDVSRELGSSISLYSRKVLIQTKATDVLPKWLRFIRGEALLGWAGSELRNTLGEIWGSCKMSDPYSTSPQVWWTVKTSP